MTDRLYKVFVSSTYTDLVEERRQVSEQLLRMDCMPAGMELFSASSQPPWDVITAALRGSDYVVLILAGRYGSSLGDEPSYTEREYDYAEQLGIPVLAFVHADPRSRPASYVDTGRFDKKLQAFVKKVRDSGRHTVAHWHDVHDLVQKVSTAVPKAINTQPRPGWVRGDDPLATGVDAAVSVPAAPRSPEPQLNVSVQPHTQYPLAAVRNNDAQVVAYADRAMEALLDGLPKPRLPMSKLGSGAASGAGYLTTLGSAFNSLNTAASSFRVPESRSEGQFRSEVEDYGEQLRRALHDALDRVAGQRLAPVTFRLANNTRRNYQDVRLEVHIPGDVRAVTATTKNTISTRDLPRPPRKWGPYADYGTAHLLQPTYAHHAIPHLLPAVEIENGGSVALRYRAVNLRPAEVIGLKPVVVVQPDSEPRVVQAQWTLTATNVDDLAEGVVDLAFEAAPVDLWSYLLEALKSDDDRD